MKLSMIITIMSMLLFLPSSTKAWSAATTTTRNNRISFPSSSLRSRPTTTTPQSSSSKSQTKLQMMTSPNPPLFDQSTTITSTLLLSTNAAKSILYDTISSLAPIFGNTMYDLAISTANLPNIVALLLVLFGATPFIYVASFGVGKLVTGLTGGDIANLNDDGYGESESSSYSSFPSGAPPPSAARRNDGYTPPPPTYLPSYSMEKQQQQQEKEPAVEYLDLRENKTFATTSLLLLSIPLYIIIQPNTFYNIFYALSIQLDNIGVGNGALGNGAFSAASNAEKISYVVTLIMVTFVSYGIVSAFIYGDGGKSSGGMRELEDNSDFDIVGELVEGVYRKFLPTALVLFAVVLAVSATN